MVVSPNQVALKVPCMEMKVVARFWGCTLPEQWAQIRSQCIGAGIPPPPEEVERGQEFLVLHSSVLEAVKEGKVWKCSLLPVLCFWEINLLSWLTFFFLHGLVESCGRWQPQTPRLHLISSGLAGTKQFTSISFAFSPRRRVKSCLDLDTFSLVTSICWADGSELQWA